MEDVYVWNIFGHPKRWVEIGFLGYLKPFFALPRSLMIVNDSMEKKVNALSAILNIGVKQWLQLPSKFIFIYFCISYCSRFR